MSFLLRQLMNSCGVFIRTFRAFFLRKFTAVTARFRQVTNFSRNATKVASASFQGAAAAVKKPTKREDYIETQRLFISKSFLILLVVGLVCFALLCWYVLWPFILSHFLTARFWQEDSRVPDWTGKVIVYADKGKHIPMYSGRLEEGVLQGTGREYDEEGLLAYEGTFLDGERSGKGVCYEDGVLVYEGQLLAGVYEGTGRLFDEDGMVYSGTFSNGLPNGTGTGYNGGVLCYQGGFVDGLYQGTGEEFYAGGTLKYKGAFSKGKYEGEGAYYTEEGLLRYKGGFSAGLYEGDGTVYLDSGDRIQSEFSAGESGGSIQWYRGGRLWYDGEADDLTPDGYGTIYASSGKVVYAGQMDHGTLDGLWLLGLTAGELRETFGEAALTEQDSGDGFLIRNADLGVTALCSYQTSGEDPQVYQVLLSPAANDPAAALLPWDSAAAAQLQLTAGREEEPEMSYTAGPSPVSVPEGGMDGEWFNTQIIYPEEAATCTLFSEDRGGAPEQILWSRAGAIVPGGLLDEAAVQAQERLDDLLQTLDNLAGGSGDEPPADPADVERLLGLMLTPEDGNSLMDALTDYYVYNQMLQALEASQPLLEQNLLEQQRLLDRGDTTQSAVDGVQDRLDALDRRLAQYRTGREQAKLTAETLTGLKLDAYDLAAVLTSFDTAELDTQALYDAALAYAKSVAAEPRDVDAADLELKLKTQILDLSMAYEEIRAGQETLERAAGVLEKTTQAYSTGTADKLALYDAQCSRNDAAAALFMSMGAYTKQAVQLNNLSGGALAEQRGWFAEPFGVLYDLSVQRNQDDQELAKNESADVPAAGGAEQEQGQEEGDSQGETEAEPETAGPVG